MDEELNDLSTDNLATTFSNDTDNTATSDELEASENYVNKMGTSYSIGKAIAKAVVITGITVTASAGGYAILSNSMVSNPATIADASFTYESDVDTLHYSFTITNTKEYPATFSLYHDSDKQVLFTLDVTKSDTYRGDITGLGYDRKIVYEVSYKANDYTGTLYKGNVTFTKNV